MEKMIKIIFSQFLKHKTTITACAFISVLGFVFVAFSSPGTALVGNNIDTDGNVSASSTITAGELLTVVPTTDYTIREVGYILDNESPQGVGTAKMLGFDIEVCVSGNYAYATAANDRGLSVIDISDPTNPVEVGCIQDDSIVGGDREVGCNLGYGLSQAFSIEVAGNYVYAVGYEGLSIVDISDPTNPVEVGYIQDSVPDRTKNLWGGNGVYVSGRYVYATSQFDDALSIIDVSDPTHPVEVGFIKDDSEGGTAHAMYYAARVFVSGRYAYVTSVSDDGFSIFDVSDPTNPVEAGYLQDNHSGGTANYLEGANGVYVSGRYAYVSSAYDDAFVIIDISDPANPVEVGHIQDDNQGGAAHALDTGGRVYVAGKYAYVTGITDDSFSIFDISDPANPVEVAYIQDAQTQGGTAQVLDGAIRANVVGKYVYISSEYNYGISILELPSADLPTADIGNLSASSIEVLGDVTVGNNLFVQAGLNVGSGGLQVVGDVGIFASSTLTSTSSQPALSVTQNGSGNIVEFKDAGTAVFYIADGGNATTTGNFNVSGSLNIGAGTPIAKHLSATSSVDFPAIGANGCNTQTVSLSGAEEGNVVSLGSSANFGSLADVVWTGWVSAANVVSIKACNASTSNSSDLSAETIRISVWKY